ncbi:hypothetical protein HK107_00200 [Parvularcula sp. ZS-1/3]|uniref:DUF4760 domain-containing protein n=1 Tax=Parvularcula mediterranea TaxID=2732508 RepID=A0A7Y3RJM2_9PROT|nr:hypothetical protein [Parvularcula mediterranea]NNU14741.1 hypothetical protein [Parvularcula mediterranea]
MTLDQIAQVAQIIGVAIVAVTLIYLTIQIKQGTAQLRSDTRQTQLENDQTGVYKFVEYPELGRIFSQEETPTFSEKTQLFFWMIGQMRAREYEWLQYKSGAMDQGSWETYRDVIYFVLGTERARDLWEICAAYFNPEFVEMVEAMTADSGTTDLWDRLAKVR